MKKRLNGIDYIVDNPSIHKKTLREWTTIKLNDLYLAYLRLLKNKNRISDNKSIYLEMFEPQKTLKGEHHNKPNKTYDSKKAHFNVERISVLELIPKEFIDLTLKGLERFQKKYGSRGIFDFNHKKASSLDSYNNDLIFSEVMSFALNKQSCLFDTVSRFNIRFINSTDSFVILDITAFMNKDFIEKTSNYVIENVNDYSEKYVMLNSYWYEYKRVGMITKSGENVKAENLELIIEDIRWKIMNEFSKYIKYLCFYNEKQIIAGVTKIESNIDFKENDDFWRSVNIDKYHSDKYKETNFYISGGNNNQIYAINYIDSNKRNDETELYTNYIDCYISNYLLSQEVIKFIRKKLMFISKKISRIKYISTRKWLRIRKKLNTSLFYETRFISEFTEPHVDSSIDNFKPFIEPAGLKLKQRYSVMPKQILKTKKLFQDTLDLFKSNIDYKTAATNDRLQRIAILISFVSIIIAVISIVFSIDVNGIPNTIKDFINWFIVNFHIRG